MTFACLEKIFRELATFIKNINLSCSSINKIIKRYNSKTFLKNCYEVNLH